MKDLPTGTITLLFTDIEGSTRLWELYPGAMRQALTRHDAIVIGAVEQHHGVVVRERGEGDSFFAVFTRATDAVAAASAIQHTLGWETWPTPIPIRVRAAIHTGEADLREGDYYGSEVNRCARLRAMAQGGQTLISQSTADLVRRSLPRDLALRALGSRRLKDLQDPERVFELSRTRPSTWLPLGKVAKVTLGWALAPHMRGALAAGGLLLALILGVAIWSNRPVSEPGEIYATLRTPTSSSQNSEGVRLTLSGDPHPVRKGEKLRLTLRIECDRDDPYEIRFHTGQEYDVYVERIQGASVEKTWTWSEGQAFSVEPRALKVHRNISYVHKIEWTPLPIEGQEPSPQVVFRIHAELLAEATLKTSLDLVVGRR